jgi:hypothetical protein
MDGSLPGSFPPPEPFVVETRVEGTSWVDESLQRFRQDPEQVLVGEIVPRGFEAYARVFHPARWFFGRSFEQSTALRWSEIAAARGKIVHPQMQIEALIDDPAAFHDPPLDVVGRGGTWSPPPEELEETEALALLPLLLPFTSAQDDAWFMLWDGYGDLGRGIDGVPRGMIHPDRSGWTQSPESTGEDIPALRHYLVVRGPLDALPTWYRWRTQGPNYWWPDDRAWVVVTEIDGFTTYVGASRSCIERVVASPLLEALPARLNDRFDFRGDTINGPSNV